MIEAETEVVDCEKVDGSDDDGDDDDDDSCGCESVRDLGGDCGCGG